jgi:CheY-like chemotaxis protein/anti-sigma regulatory factor (Ser/Thr protein kinase)
MDRSVFVLADQQRFKQVLLNLLTNAVNYNLSSGSVTVSYEADGKEKVRIFVNDTGIGIPEEKINRLFMPFERLGAEHSNIDGTGLGLALSQRLMQAMGGSIGVESKVGKGSTFWMELPETQPPVPKGSLPVKIAEENGQHSADAHRKVLYIEDNLSNLALVEQLLEERPGIELLSAERGEAGIALAQEHLPDLILLDVHLPDCDGSSVLSRLKASEATCDIPVVILSADATDRQIDRLMTAGASTYLTKPIDIADFFRVLDKTARTNGKRASASCSKGTEQRSLNSI